MEAEILWKVRTLEMSVAILVSKIGIENTDPFCEVDQTPTRRLQKNSASVWSTRESEVSEWRIKLNFLFCHTVHLKSSTQVSINFNKEKELENGKDEIERTSKVSNSRHRTHLTHQKSCK